jgi:hypothetical protein
MTTLLPRRTHTTVVERTLRWFVAEVFFAEISVRLDSMNAILDYTAQSGCPHERPSRQNEPATFFRELCY